LQKVEVYCAVLMQYIVYTISVKGEIKMKTQKLMLLLVLCLTVVFAGCGTSSGKKEGSHAASNRQGENASGDKVTLSFMHLWPDGVSTAQNNVVNDIIGQYEADNPNVKIKVEVLDNEQYKNKLKILSTS